MHTHTRTRTHTHTHARTHTHTPHNTQARDVLTYGTSACVQHAFRRYCYKRLDILRQQRPKSAHRDGKRGAGSGAAPTGQRWWLERDKGVELSPAQIEMRLLATRALDGDWRNLVAGGGSGQAGEQGRAAGCPKAASANGANASGGQAEDCVVIEDDEDSQSADRAPGAVRGIAAEAKETEGGGQRQMKRVLERVVVPADDGSEDDDVPLAVKQQKLRDAKRAAGEEGGSSSSAVSRSSSASSSSSCASSVSCPSPTAMAEAAEKRGRSSGADDAGATCATEASERKGKTSEPPAKKSKKQEEEGEEARESPDAGQHMDQDDTRTNVDPANVRAADSVGGAQISGCETVNSADQVVKGAQEGVVEVKPDPESTSRALGVPREMVGGWAEEDVEMLAKHLSAHETGGMSRRELARQGMLEAFVVAV